jgi:hypothetical protein
MDADDAVMDYRDLRAFVSSRLAELADERRAIKAALAKLRIHAWVFEEPDGAGARAQSIQRTYLDELKQADLYIGVFWRGYGAYTEDEYRHAVAWRKPILIYEKRLLDKNLVTQEQIDAMQNESPGAADDGQLNLPRGGHAEPQRKASDHGIVRRLAKPSIEVCSSLVRRTRRFSYIVHAVVFVFCMDFESFLCMRVAESQLIF